MFENKKTKTIWIICLSILFSMTYIVSTSHARYASYAEGKATGEIANFYVTANSSSNNISIIAGETANFTVTVSSNSDVYVGYSITIDNIPNDVQVRLDSGSYVTPTNNQVVFSDVNQLEYDGVSTRSHTITFSTTVQSNAVSINNVEISVDFEQV